MNLGYNKAGCVSNRNKKGMSDFHPNTPACQLIRIYESDIVCRLILLSIFDGLVKKYFYIRY